MDNVSAIIVTRGDVDLTLIYESLPKKWERLVWDNSGEVLSWRPHGLSEQTGHVGVHQPVSDLGVYGRYAAIEYASHDLIYVQDDDCIVSDPQAIVGAWKSAHREASVGKSGMINLHTETRGHVVCNMSQRFRGQGLYATDEHALVGFGAAFHRDAPAQAFRRYWGNGGRAVAASVQRQRSYNGDIFRRTCDIVFTALTPRVLVDVPYENLPHAYADGRMYRQPGHQSERTRMLKLVRKVK